MCVNLEPLELEEVNTGEHNIVMMVKSLVKRPMLADAFREMQRQRQFLRRNNCWISTNIHLNLMVTHYM